MEFQDSSYGMIRKGIIELYLNVKIRSAEEIQQINEDKMKEEMNRLKKVDSMDIIDYIK